MRRGSMAVGIGALPAIFVLALLVPGVYLLMIHSGAQETSLGILLVGCAIVIAGFAWASLSLVKHADAQNKPKP